MNLQINKNTYKNIKFFILSIIVILILYNSITFIKNYYKSTNKTYKTDKSIEPFGIKKIGRGIKKGFKKATSKISDAAKKAADEAKRVAEETKKAAEEAKRLAEEAAQAIQIQNAIKELNRSINRTSDIFKEIGNDIAEIKGLGSSYSKSVSGLTNSFDRL